MANQSNLLGELQGNDPVSKTDNAQGVTPKDLHIHIHAPAYTCTTEHAYTHMRMTVHASAHTHTHAYERQSLVTLLFSPSCQTLKCRSAGAQSTVST